jgi:hypothetical protein
MQYDSEFADGAAQLAAELADEVEYFSALAPQEPFFLSVILSTEQVEERQESNGMKRHHTREVTIPRTSAAAGGDGSVFSPSIHDRFVFRGEDFKIEQILTMTASIARVKAVRIAVHEKAREGYRRQQ